MLLGKGVEEILSGKLHFLCSGYPQRLPVKISHFSILVRSVLNLAGKIA